MRITTPKFVWQDMWVGAYVKTNPVNGKYRVCIFVCLVPMFPFQIIFYKKGSHDTYQEENNR